MYKLKRVSIFIIFCYAIIQQSAILTADEASTAKRFEYAKASEPQLIAFIKDMPKGADLHNHVSGAMYAETILDAAIKSNLYFDPTGCTFVKEQTQGAVPAKDLLQNNELAIKYLNVMSMRGCYSCTENGHDHFFAIWNHFGAAADKLPKEAMMTEVINRAKAQNVQYMELMTGVAPDGVIPTALQNPLAIDDMDKALDEIRIRFPAVLVSSKAFMDQRDVELARLVAVKSPITGTSGPINVRYIFSVSRNTSNESFFANMACGLMLVKNDRRIVAVNILSPEDYVKSRQNFDTQMRIIDFLWKKLGKPKLTLHAGELTLLYSPVEDMRSRIRKSIELGHASRIGHGISIAWEDNLPDLLREMKNKHICVEICLSSNDKILNVSGNKHPFNLYREAGVPMCLNTDDEGVNRSNLTMEFVRAIRTYNLSYKDVKQLARNSIEYSFLSGRSLYENGNYSNVIPDFKGVRNMHWKPSAQASKFMKTSDKLAVQVRLERAFAAFEN